MVSPAEIGMGAPEKKGALKSIEYEREWGHDAEDLLIEILEENEYVDRVERSTQEEDVQEKIDMKVWFIGEKEPICIQLFSGNNESIAERKKEQCRDHKVGLVWDKQGALRRALSRAEESGKEPIEHVPEADKIELMGLIIDTISKNEKQGFLMRLQGRLGKA